MSVQSFMQIVIIKSSKSMSQTEDILKSSWMYICRMSKKLSEHLELVWNGSRTSYAIWDIALSFATILYNDI